MSCEGIEAGDVVHVGDDHPAMLVEIIYPKKSAVLCSWMEGGEVKEKILSLEHVKKLENYPV